LFSAALQACLQKKTETKKRASGARQALLALAPSPLGSAQLILSSRQALIQKPQINDLRFSFPKSFK